MSDDVEVRLAVLEERMGGLDIAIRAELRGYLDGQVKSILNNIQVNHDHLQRQVDGVKITVHGQNGDNGLRSDVQAYKIMTDAKIGRLTLINRIYAGMLLALFTNEFGLRFGLW